MKTHNAIMYTLDYVRVITRALESEEARAKREAEEEENRKIDEEIDALFDGLFD